MKKLFFPTLPSRAFRRIKGRHYRTTIPTTLSPFNINLIVEFITISSINSAEIGKQEGNNPLYRRPRPFRYSAVKSFQLRSIIERFLKTKALNLIKCSSKASFIFLFFLLLLLRESMHKFLCFSDFQCDNINDGDVDYIVLYSIWVFTSRSVGKIEFVKAKIMLFRSYEIDILSTI